MDEIAEGRGRSALRQRSTTPTAPACTMCGRPSHMFDQGVQFRCRNCDDEWTIHITNHAWDRWEERSEAPDEHPIERYKHAIRFLDEGTRVKGDEFRYDHLSRCLLIRRKHKVVTIEHVPSCRAPIQRAAVRSLIRADGSSPAPIAELCQECDMTVEKLKEIVRFERGNIDEDVLSDDSDESNETDTTLRAEGSALSDTEATDQTQDVIE